MSTNIIKLAGAIKPPATRTEIIEALSIRKLAQLVKEKEANDKEIVRLEAKIQVVAAEEMAKGGKPGNDCNSRPYFNVTVRKDNNGRLEVHDTSCLYKCPPSPELRELARTLWKLRHNELRCVPSLNDVRKQVRAALAEQTPPNRRVKDLLASPETSQLIDNMLARLDGKPLALTA